MMCKSDAEAYEIRLYNQQVMREQIAQDIEKLLEHREDFCDEYDEAIMKAAECVRFPDEVKE